MSWLTWHEHAGYLRSFGLTQNDGGILQLYITVSWETLAFVSDPSLNLTSPASIPVLNICARAASSHPIRLKLVYDTANLKLRQQPGSLNVSWKHDTLRINDDVIIGPCVISRRDTVINFKSVYSLGRLKIMLVMLQPCWYSIFLIYFLTTQPLT